MKHHAAFRNLKLVIFESAITAGLLSMSIMTPFFHSIGLNQAEIALSQALFTVVVMLLNVPTGWLADHLSRKWANVIGDFGVAIVLIFYTKANNLSDVIVCECMFGLFSALSQGVDYSLLLHFSRQITSKEEFFRQKSSQLSFYRNLAALVIVLLGGPIGAISFRLAIALSSLSYFAGGIASLFIRDDSERLQPQHANPFVDMSRIMHYSLTCSRLRTRILAYASGREMTHCIIWVFTPMLLLAGVPLWLVSAAWALNSLAAIFGSRLAMRFGSKLSAWQVFAVALGMMALSMGILSIRINIWTVGFYLLMGVTQGWTDATLMPLVQEVTPAPEQASVISFAKTIGELIYIPTVYIMGWLADFDLRYAALATLLIFLSFGIFLTLKLTRE